MTDVSRPRPEFRDELRDWFVEAMSSDDVADAQPRPNRVRTIGSVADDDPGADTGRRSITWLAATAAAVVMLVGVVAFRAGAPDTEPVRSVPAPPATATLVAACTAMGGPVAPLPLGASPDDIVDAADHSAQRLSAALLIVAGDDATAASSARSLLERGLVTAERLRRLADADDRVATDEAIAQLDQLVIAWAKEMRSLGANSCHAVRLLREVGP